MSLNNGNTIEENKQYSFVLAGDKATLMFIWKPIEGLVVEQFQRGISGFAVQCKTHKPSRVVIDAAALDQGSPAVA